MPHSWPNLYLNTTRTRQVSWDRFSFNRLANSYYSKGPITGADGDAGAFLPLEIITDQFQRLINEARSQRASQYLPSTYDLAVVKGFEAQRNILLDSYASNTTAVIELPFTGKSGSGNLLLKPLSRGSINIDPTNPSGGPVIDFGVLTNPVDLKINLAAVKLSRVIYSSPHMAALGPVETNPGVNVTTDEAITTWIHNTLLPSAAHPCGTASMMPRDCGGVVGPDLLVYGLRGLSVVDASIMPLIPGTHLSATVYAVAEKVLEFLRLLIAIPANLCFRQRILSRNGLRKIDLKISDAGIRPIAYSGMPWNTSRNLREDDMYD